MKATLLIVLFLMTSSALVQAQTPEMRVAPSCGLNEIKFEVKTAKNPRPAGQPEAGKALVYFFDDSPSTGWFPNPKLTTRAGVDGAWVGATQRNAYFYFSVDPGEHHLCASWQTWLGPGVNATHKTVVTHFTAEAGTTYYFKVGGQLTQSAVGINLDPLDSDEGQFLVSKFSISTFQQKK
jgi:hypothetical protein